MKKGIYIDESRNVEIVKFTKISEYVSGEKTKLTDILTIHASSEAEDFVTINDDEYGLPALVVPKAKMNEYDMEELLSLFENADFDEGLEISDEDFFSEDDEDEDEDENEDFDSRDSDWY